MEANTLTNKQIMKLSELSQCVGEMLGTLEGLAYHLQDTDERIAVFEKIGFILEQDPVGEFLKSLFETEDGE